ncbi:MAG: DUF3662 domain-containing protein [Coriobacteriia bacterium]|nr:DUF3662 domain-containing protein [Coriobacteriia bacterium]
MDKFEEGLENAFEKAGTRVFKGTIEPAQVAKRAEKQMKREKLVGAGKQYAPTLYTVLVNDNDDKRLFAFYPTLAAEIETYLMSRGADAALSFDGRPLVRFIVDKKLKSGRFDVVAEIVSNQIIEQLRDEEAEYYGLIPKSVNFEPERDYHAEDYREEIEENLQSDLKAILRQVHGSEMSPTGTSMDAFENSDEFATVEPIREGAIGESVLICRQSGISYLLSHTRMTIGRGDQCDIVLNDANASRTHAVLSQNALGVWKIADSDSTNGTLVNDRVVDQIILRPGDQLTIGVTLLEFVSDILQSAKEEPPALDDDNKPIGRHSLPAGEP